ncbi:hypothetical protein [Methanosphaera cuniculi]|uniref:hypothetical protein n=1 Tax=Methanosphaera cuniculi TaxID=1077256 RepID=UPI0026EB0BA8|nr:hypothetical protein [Methanosphaera cuniculi]
MEAKQLRLETKCYDANEYGYLYGLNQKIPDSEFEKIKPYMKNFRRKDFIDGIIKVTGRPEGYRCLKEDVPKIEEILNIENTVAKREEKIRKAMQDPHEKEKLKDQTLQWIQALYTKGGTQPEQDLSRLVIHSTKIYDPNDSYKNGKKEGRGVLFIYTPHGIWYIINNSGENANTSLNNVKTHDGGAIGYRLMYDDNLDTIVRIYSEENLYTGDKLY